MVAAPSSGFPPRPARSRSVDENDILTQPAMRAAAGPESGRRIFQDDQAVIPWWQWIDQLDGAARRPVRCAGSCLGPRTRARVAGRHGRGGWRGRRGRPGLDRGRLAEIAAVAFEKLANPLDRGGRFQAVARPSRDDCQPRLPGLAWPFPPPPDPSCFHRRSSSPCRPCAARRSRSGRGSVGNRIEVWLATQSAASRL